MNIVITDHVEVSSDAEEALKAVSTNYYSDLPQNETEIIDRIRDAELITANYIDITSKVIDAAPKLKFIVVPAVGYEWVDYRYAASKGIKVINCPTFNALAVAEHAFALLFSVARSIPESANTLLGGQWKSKDFIGVEIQGKKLGVVGNGNIAKKIMTLAVAIGMQVAFIDSKSSADELDDMLANSDVICLSLSLNNSSHHLIDQRRLSLMKETAILINVARGAIVDQKALLDVLKAKKIWGAGLDVFEDEPLMGTPSAEILDLAALNNVTATPHIAYNTAESAIRLGEELIHNIQSCIDGNPQNIVN